jgi:hypothetical protein
MMYDLRSRQSVCTYLSRPEDHRALPRDQLKKGQRDSLVAVMIVCSVFRIVFRLAGWGLGGNLGHAASIPPRLLLHTFCRATDSFLYCTARYTTKANHLHVTIFTIRYTLEMFRPCRGVVPPQASSKYSQPASNQPRKPLPADEILKGCHYGIHLLLHVTTAEPLVGNSQESKPYRSSC